METAQTEDRPELVDLQNMRSVAIAENTVFVQVSFSMWGIDRKLRKDEFETEASKERVAATKRLITGPEYRAIEKLTWTTRDKIADDYALPCSMARLGNYMVAIPMIDTVERFLRQRKAEWDAAVDAFIDKYENLKATARLPKEQGGLGPLFDEKQYPPAVVVRAKFGMSHRWYTTIVPDSLQALDNALFQAEVEKDRSSVASAYSEIRQGLVAAFGSLVKRMTERLTDNDDGTQRVFKGTMVSKMDEFLDTVTKRDVTNFPELRRLADEARAIMEQVPDAQTLRDDGALREFVRSNFASIEARLDTMVEDVGRAFSFDDQ